MKEYWITKGSVTDPEAHLDAEIGDTEWQFSDGPPGERGSSQDYLTLEAGIADTSPAIYHWVPTPRFEPVREGFAYRAFDNHEQVWVGPALRTFEAARALATYMNRIHDDERASAATARNWPGVGEPAKTRPDWHTTDKDGNFARAWDLPEEDLPEEPDESDEPEESTIATVKAEHADHVGRLLLMLIEATNLGNMAWVLVHLGQDPRSVELVANALIALGNDTDSITTT